MRDTSSHAEALLCVSASSRDEVDELTDSALEAGGSPASEPQDQGFMYARSFQDPDGHQWTVMWMDPSVLERGPHATASAA
jgi:predicted lactoylglutathione lyase